MEPEQQTRIDVICNGARYVLVVQSDQLDARRRGDLITAEIVDVAPSDVGSFC